jgi:hypothetical protein
MVRGRLDPDVLIEYVMRPESKMRANGTTFNTLRPPVLLKFVAGLLSGNPELFKGLGANGARRALVHHPQCVINTMQQLITLHGNWEQQREEDV